MANWYTELLEIHKVHPIEKIALKDSAHKYDWDVREQRRTYFGDFGTPECIAILDYEFDDGYGGTEGPEFTAWTEGRVFFPWRYDGAEGISWVPRHPCNEATEHIGGG